MISPVVADLLRAGSGAGAHRCRQRAHDAGGRAVRRTTSSQNSAALLLTTLSKARIRRRKGCFCRLRARLGAVPLKVLPTISARQRRVQRCHGRRTPTPERRRVSNGLFQRRSKAGQRLRPHRHGCARRRFPTNLLRFKAHTPHGHVDSKRLRPICRMRGSTRHRGSEPSRHATTVSMLTLAVAS